MWAGVGWVGTGEGVYGAVGDVSTGQLGTLDAPACPPFPAAPLFPLCRSQDFEKAGQLRDREMELKAQIQAITQNAKDSAKAELESGEGGGPLVTEQDIANIVAQWTGIPVEKVGGCRGGAAWARDGGGWRGKSGGSVGTGGNGLPQMLQMSHGRYYSSHPVHYRGGARSAGKQTRGSVIILRVCPLCCLSQNLRRPRLYPLTHPLTPPPAPLLTQVSSDETERLVKMEEVLHGRVIGQEEAVTAISRAIRRARVGLKNPNRPIASFIFSGPTGVGKSELAKTLASYYFGSEDAMVRLDMSEFMERHTVSYLLMRLFNWLFLFPAS